MLRREGSMLKFPGSVFTREGTGPRREGSPWTGLWAVVMKEMADHLSSVEHIEPRALARHLDDAGNTSEDSLDVFAYGLHADAVRSTDHFLRQTFDRPFQDHLAEPEEPDPVTDRLHLVQQMR